MDPITKKYYKCAMYLVDWCTTSSQRLASLINNTNWFWVWKPKSVGFFYGNDDTDDHNVD